jgi:F-type H+-transporting ATPase subunit b
MLIDWFTVGAQVLNFLVLVWLMKRFLYKPILNAIDTRERRIAKELSDADARSAGAQSEREDLERERGKFDEQRSALLAQAVEEAEVEKERLLDVARNAAETRSAGWRESLATESRNLDQAIARRVQDEVFAIARKALADLASSSLEQQMTDVLNRRLRALDGESKQGLADSLKHAAEPALVRSTFELPGEQRAAIQKALNETFSAEVPIRFETAPGLICGVELSTSGRKVGWNFAQYLASIHTAVVEVSKASSEPIRAEADTVPLTS